MSNGIEPIVVPEPIPEPTPEPVDVIREKIFPIKEPVVHYLSAQEYGLMTANEKQLIKDVLGEKKTDSDEYDKKMKKLWPKEVTPKPLSWRRK